MARFTWMNGQLVDEADARVPFLTAGLHYGMAVFEGIRCYDTPSGPAVFRLREHLERLEASARVLGFLDLPYGVIDSSRPSSTSSEPTRCARAMSGR